MLLYYFGFLYVPDIKNEIHHFKIKQVILYQPFIEDISNLLGVADFRYWLGFFSFKGGYPGTLRQYSNHWPLGFDTLFYLGTANTFLISLDWVFLLGLTTNGHLRFIKNFNAEEPKLYTFAVNSIAWTVGLELMFYLFAPYVLRKTWKTLVALLIISFGIRLWLIATGNDTAPYNYMFFPTQVMFFMAGSLSYRFYEKINFAVIKKSFLTGFYLLLLIAVLSFNYLPFSIYFKQSILYIITAISIPFIFQLFKTSKIDRFLGDMSYPMYILQALVIQVTSVKMFPKLFGSGFTAVAVTLAFSLTLHYIIQVPLEKYRQRRVVRMKEKENFIQPESTLNLVPFEQ